MQTNLCIFIKGQSSGLGCKWVGAAPACPNPSLMGARLCNQDQCIGFWKGLGMSFWPDKGQIQAAVCLKVQLINLAQPCSN